MSLVDSKETRIAVSLNWNPTIEEIERVFEEGGMSSIIDQLLQEREVKHYFEYRLVQDYESFTNPKVQFEERVNKDIEWLLNREALLRDIKLNIEVKVLKDINRKKPSKKELCEKLSKNIYDIIYDIIYNMEEDIDNILGSLHDNPFTITLKRRQDEKNNNVIRESIILLE